MRIRRFLVPTLVLGFGLGLATGAGAGTGHGKDAKYGKCEMDTQACLDKMTAHLANAGYLGIEYDDEASSSATAGIAVTKVLSGTPAEKAGLRAGDVLVALNGIAINEANNDALKTARATMGPGTTVRYTIAREGKSMDIAVTLAAMPKEVIERNVGAHMVAHAKGAEVTQAAK